MDKDVVVTDDQQAELAFDSGFGIEIVAPDKPAATTETKPADATPAAAPPPAEKPTPPPAPAAPEYAQFTKEEYGKLMAAVDLTATMKGQIDKLFGNLGGMNRIVTELQAATPKGDIVELSDDVVADLHEDYPQLADQMLKVLRKALAGKTGTAPAPAPEKEATISPETVGKIVRDENEQREIDALNDDHPKWREIVGIVDNDGKLLDPKNEFRAWLAKQPEAYQTKVNLARRASTIAKSIDAFLADKAKAQAAPPQKTPPKGAVRRDVIRDAVQPKGDSSMPSPANSAEAEFDKGFKTG